MNNIVSAAFVIIGNEILSGRTKDENLNFLATELNNVGIQLKESRIIPDDENEIIFTINELRKKFNYVFTSGGIGPTHDDITSQAIANAFNDNLIKNKEAEKILIQHYGNQINQSQIKMAYVPSKARLLDNPISSAPGFIIENVIVMAGVPKIMKVMLEAAKKELITGHKMESREVKISLTESLIADDLAKLQKEFPNVSMGSYPFNGGTSLVFRSTNIKDLEESFAKITSMVKNAIILKTIVEN